MNCLFTSLLNVITTQVGEKKTKQNNALVGKYCFHRSHLSLQEFLVLPLHGHAIPLSLHTGALTLGFDKLLKVNNRFMIGEKQICKVCRDIQIAQKALFAKRTVNLQDHQQT